MRFAELVAVAERVAATASRLEKVELIAALLRRLEPAELPIALGLLSGAPRQGKLGVGWAMVGSTLRAAAGTASPGELTLADLDAALTALGAIGGAGAHARRHDALAALARGLTLAEQDFLARLLLGELRQGALEGVMLDAVARAAAVSPIALRAAVVSQGDLAAVAVGALGGQVEALATSVVPFRPLRPMLAQSAEDVAEALTGLAVAGLEHKLDGARVQLHKRGDEVRLFSRALREVTASAPELVAAGRALAAETIILDGEAISLRPDGRPQPFQTTMRRFGRKLDVAGQAAELPLIGIYFDCLLLDGESLVERPLAARLAALDAAVPEAFRMPRLATGDPTLAAEFFAAALAAGHEGVMVKDLAAPYRAGQRGGAWRKLKQARSLDLVVLAAEWGSGRRRGSLSNLHLGARDPAGGFVMLGKTFKGMTDELLAWQTRELLARETARDGHIVLVRPELVIEIAFNEVQHSTQYPGGVTLRFARVKGYRPDKSPAEADTIDAVRALRDQPG